MGMPTDEQAMAVWRRWQRIRLRAKELMMGGMQEYVALYKAEQEMMNERTGEVSAGDGAGGSACAPGEGGAAVQGRVV